MSSHSIDYSIFGLCGTVVYTAGRCLAIRFRVRLECGCFKTTFVDCFKTVIAKHVLKGDGLTSIRKRLKIVKNFAVQMFITDVCIFGSNRKSKFLEAVVNSPRTDTKESGHFWHCKTIF